MIPQASWLADFMAAEDLPSTFAATALTHWTPLADRIGVLAAEARRPFFVGLCGAQGSGKSTVAAVIAHRLRTQDLQVAVLSIDDVYLPREARLDLARRVHPLLTTRGPPGTHDLELAGAVFDGLSRAGPVALPSRTVCRRRAGAGCRLGRRRFLGDSVDDRFQGVAGSGRLR